MPKASVDWTPNPTQIRASTSLKGQSDDSEHMKYLKIYKNIKMTITSHVPPKRQGCDPQTSIPTSHLDPVNPLKKQ